MERKKQIRVYKKCSKNWMQSFLEKGMDYTVQKIGRFLKMVFEVGITTQTFYTE